MILGYPGLSPSNVSNDAKYHIRRGVNGIWEIRIPHRTSFGTVELRTIDPHDRLIKAVNDVKKKLNGQPGGSFYINEFGHVLVPSIGNPTCAYAGTYDELLRFDYFGQEISCLPSPGLSPGRPWTSLKVGIRYILDDATDIRQPSAPQHRLSDFYGPRRARALASRLARFKRQGARIYINEAREFFAPITDFDESVGYVYLGPLQDDDVWFPAPPVPPISSFQPLL